jgi:hypothetical protein
MARSIDRAGAARKCRWLIDPMTGGYPRAFA